MRTHKTIAIKNINIQLPQQVFNQKLNFKKVFILALLISMGTSILSCTNHKGKTQKINTVEIIDTIQTTKNQIILDSIPTSKTKKDSSLLQKEIIEEVFVEGEIIEVPEIPKEDPLLNVLGGIEIEDGSDDIENDTSLDTIPFGIVEIPPEYPNTPKYFSKEEKQKYFTKSIHNFIINHFPKNEILKLNLDHKLRIYAKFDINTKGTIENIKIRASHPKIEDYTLRAIKQIPKLIPGKNKSKNVITSYALPITFML